MAKECPNNRAMLIIEDGEYNSTSEAKSDHAHDLKKYDDANSEDEGKGVYCDFEQGINLVVNTKVLSVKQREDNDQRCTLFQTKAKVGNHVCKMIIDGGSCHNLASKELCDKLGLTCQQHPHPYHVQWLSDCGEVNVQSLVKVPFQIGKYIDTIECDVVPMMVCHLLLGQP